MANKRRVLIRGSKEWNDWLDRFAAWQQRPLATIVEMALRDLAAKLGYEESPPVRHYGRAGVVPAKTAADAEN